MPTFVYTKYQQTVQTRLYTTSYGEYGQYSKTMIAYSILYMLIRDHTQSTTTLAKFGTRSAEKLRNIVYIMFISLK